MFLSLDIIVYLYIIIINIIEELSFLSSLMGVLKQRDKKFLDMPFGLSMSQINLISIYY